MRQNAAKDREQLEALSNALPVEGRPSFVCRQISSFYDQIFVSMRQQNPIWN